MELSRDHAGTGADTYLEPWFIENKLVRHTLFWIRDDLLSVPSGEVWWRYDCHKLCEETSMPEEWAHELLAGLMCDKYLTYDPDLSEYLGVPHYLVDYDMYVVDFNLLGEVQDEDLDQHFKPPELRPRKAHKKRHIGNNLRTKVFERDAYRCKRCSAWHDLCADHIIPESKGGSTTLENLQTLCRSCNSSKGAR